MKCLVIGLGSMGKRRVRNLKFIGANSIAGFDIRADRCTEAYEKYGIRTYSDFNYALDSFRPDALVISTSPEHHMTYAWEGFEHRIPCFIEASVVEAELILKLYHLTKETSLLMAPSCTMRYFPGPKKVKELIRAGIIGRPLNINYQTGQYLLDWHPWENIEDFYVSARETGGCREIVPFELTWLNDIFGEPEALACVKGKLTTINANIDDLYHCLLRYPSGLFANLTVEVISRPQPTRELRINGTEGEIIFSTDEHCVRYANTNCLEWQRFDLDKGTVETGYINPEEPYIAEMRSFIEAVVSNDKAVFPNTLLDDYRVLKTLHRLEELAETTK